MFGPRAIFAGLGATLGLCQGLGHVVRDCALTCNVGYQRAPLAFLTLALVSAPVIALQIRWSHRLGARRFLIRCAILVATGQVGFRLATYLAVTHAEVPVWLLRGTYVGFYIWLDLTFLLLSSTLLALVHERESDQEHLLAVVGAAVYAGALAGSALAAPLDGWFAHLFPGRFEIARDHLMLAMAVATLLLLPLALTHRASPGQASRLDTGRAGLRAALAATIADRTLFRIATLFAATGASAILLDYLVYWILSQSGGEAGLVPLFARLYLWMNAASLVLLAGGAARLIRRLGLALALCALPAGLLGGTSLLLFHTVVPVLLGIRVLEECLWSGLYEPATERLLARVDRRRYTLVRPVLEGLSQRVGMGVGALLVLVLSNGLGLSQRGTIIALLGLHVLWLCTVLAIARSFRTLEKTT